jgi:hypothetical protein
MKCQSETQFKILKKNGGIDVRMFIVLLTIKATLHVTLSAELDEVSKGCGSKHQSLRQAQTDMSFNDFM